MPASKDWEPGQGDWAKGASIIVMGTPPKGSLPKMSPRCQSLTTKHCTSLPCPWPQLQDLAHFPFLALTSATPQKLCIALGCPSSICPMLLMIVGIGTLNSTFFFFNLKSNFCENWLGPRISPGNLESSRSESGEESSCTPP